MNSAHPVALTLTWSAPAAASAVRSASIAPTQDFAVSPPTLYAARSAGAIDPTTTLHLRYNNKQQSTLYIANTSQNDPKTVMHNNY